MKPTQAQIEAALKAFSDIMDAERDEELWSQRRKKAIAAALTAAAEARYSEPQGTGFQAGEAEPAAAEAASCSHQWQRRYLGDYKFARFCTVCGKTENIPDWTKKRADIRNSAIERCAQMVKECEKGSGRDLSDVIAAIRALKVQP